MRTRISIILIALLTLSCHSDNKVLNSNCEKTLNKDSIFSEYERKGQPLAEIDFNKPLNQEWTQSDFQLLRLILEEANPNLYRYTNKSTIDSLFEASLCELNDSIYYLDFIKHIAKVFNTMACGHSGWSHTKSFKSFRRDSMKFFPLDILSVDDQYFIVKNNSTDDSIAEGTEIISVNGLKPVSINEKLRKYMYRDGESIPNAETEISKYFKNAYLNFISAPDTFSLVIKDSTDETSQIKLPAKSKNSIDSISQARYGNNKQELGKPLLFEIDSTNSIARYTIKWFRNEYIHQKGQNFNSFTDSVFQEIRTKKIENLVIDLRGNVGGWTANGKKLFSYFTEDPIPYISKVELSAIDSFSFEPLMLFDQGISDTMRFNLNENGYYEWTNYPNQIANPASKNQFKGKTYVLIDEETRSCSSVFSSMMKNHTNATFIGEECGAAQCGSGGMVIAMILPYTGVVVFTSTARYSTNVPDSKISRGVKADYPVKTSIHDHLNNHDKQIEFTYELINKTNHNKNL